MLFMYHDMRPMPRMLFSLAADKIDYKKDYKKIDFSSTADKAKLATSYLASDVVIRVRDQVNEAGPSIRFLTFAKESYHGSTCRDLMTLHFHLTLSTTATYRSRAKGVVKIASQEMNDDLGPRDLIKTMADNIQSKMTFWRRCWYIRPLDCYRLLHSNSSLTI
jgi:hypothetical protein